MARGFFSPLLILVGIVIIFAAMGVVTFLLLPKPSHTPQATPTVSSPLNIPKLSPTASPKRATGSGSQATPSAAVTRSVLVGTAVFKIPDNWKPTTSQLDPGYSVVAAPTTVSPKSPVLFVQIVPTSTTSLQSAMAAYQLPNYRREGTYTGAIPTTLIKGTVGSGSTAKQETVWFFETGGNVYFIRGLYDGAQPDPTIDQVFTQIVNSFQF